jgi:hypothetical protein
MLFNLFILFTIIIKISSFILKPNKFISTKLNCIHYDEYKPKFEHFEYNENKETYTIIAVNNDKTINLLKNIKLNRINYVYIDIYHFTYDEILEIYKFYSINYTPDTYNQPHIFLGPDYYIGSTFEMYEIISKY